MPIILGKNHNFSFLRIGPDSITIRPHVSQVVLLYFYNFAFSVRGVRHDFAAAGFSSMRRKSNDRIRSIPLRQLTRTSGSLVPLMRHVIRGGSCANLIISSAYSAAHQSRPWKLPASAPAITLWKLARGQAPFARARVHPYGCVSQVYFQIRLNRRVLVSARPW